MKLRMKGQEPPLWRQILGTLLIMTLLVGLFGVVEKAWGTEKQGPTRTAAQRMPAQEPFSPRVGARKFRHHKLGNSRGFEIPRHLKKKIARYNRRHRPVANARIGDWWQWPFTTANCIWWKQRTWDCAYHESSRLTPSLKRDMRHVEYVVGGCSGGAYVAHFIYRVWEPAYQAYRIGRHGWLTIGAGATVCAWERTWDKWF